MPRAGLMDANGELLRRAFDAAIAASRPEAWLGKALDGVDPPAGRTLVIAIGKAGVGMAKTFAERWSGPFRGLIVTPHGTGEAVDGFRVLEAAHPVPDETSLAAGEAALTMAATARPEDLVLVLLSGGASALACAPIPGVSLMAKAELTRILLGSGLDIAAINTVRRALSRLKGGGLGRAANGARVVTLAQSDVPGDDLRAIGSGLGMPVPPDPEAAIAGLTAVAPGFAPLLAGPIRAWAASLPAADWPWRGAVAFGAAESAEAAAAVLRGAGLTVELAGSCEGDAVKAARRQAAELEGVGDMALISWGETTVAVPPEARGRGGRNQHFLLALAIELAGRGDVWALAADSDGIDGTSDAAGALIDPALLRELDGPGARASLAACDAHGFFARRRRLIQTGPTGVNVGDLRIVLVASGSGP